MTSTPIAEVVGQPMDRPKIVRFTRTSIVIDQVRSFNEAGEIERHPVTEQRTLRGRVVGVPTVTWKEHKFGRTVYSPWPIAGLKRYLMVRFGTRRHGVLTLPLPPSATDELVRLEAEVGSLKEVDLVVSMVDKGGYFFATFAMARSSRVRNEDHWRNKEAA